MSELGAKDLLRILHLEDEPNDQELVRATFEAEGVACRIEAVATREAFESALERDEFDLILSDFSLPSFDGLTALKLARERTQDVPVIFLSGTIGEEAAIEAVRNGATDYVLKQRLARLVPAVRRAVSEAQALHKRHQIEESLRREREFSGQLVESSVDGILAFDRSLRITAWNPGLERMTGVLRDNALGRSALEFFPCLKDISFEVLAGDLETERSMVAKDVAFTVTQTGRAGFFDGHFSPLRDPTGTVTGWLSIMHDITARRGLEEQFRQAQKMDAVGRLAGGVAHDFNNLLTAILGYSGLMRLRLAGQEAALKDLAEIELAANRAASLTKQLLALSRKQVMNPRVIDLNGVVLNMDKMLRRLIGEEVDLKSVPQTDLGRVKADPGQVEQVLMNLVVNARDAMPGGGKLTIETANITLKEGRVGGVEDLIPGPYVMLAVSDTGIGMDELLKSKIFEPFFTTKGVGHGTGLGLSTVHGIVKQSGGHIEVYSERGKGTTFKVYFPRVEEDLEDARHDQGERPEHGGQENVLLIEDDDLVRTVTARGLRANGYHVSEAATRADALDLARDRRGGFDLIVTDVVMPGMSLTEMVARIRAALPGARILYMSGYTDRAILRQEQFGSIEAFLQKPFTIDDLLAKVRGLLDEPPAAAA